MQELDDQLGATKNRGSNALLRFLSTARCLVAPAEAAGSVGAQINTPTVFTLASGRSGTKTLAELFKRNAPKYRVVHEPQLNLWNPGMQGPAIYDHSKGNYGALRRLLRRKRRAIRYYRTPTYIETSNVFLKSYFDLAPEFFPNTKVVHLIRHPLEAARSMANRENYLCDRGLYRYYRGRDGRQYRWWCLTGFEPIFNTIDLAFLTLFQFHLVQWIEIENRAMEYLRRFDMHSRCLTLQVPQDLNCEEAAAEILDFVGINQIGQTLLPGVQNRTPGYETWVGEEELSQCRDVVSALPAGYLEIFQREPYVSQPWAKHLAT